MSKKTIQNIALFIALLFHVSGLIGILFTPYKEWFIHNTGLTLLVMGLLLVITHPLKNKSFFIFLIASIIIGFLAEVIGVNTGFLFGDYTYGNVLGKKIFNVPLIIGANWFITIYCVGMITQAYENMMIKKINSSGLEINNRMMLISFIVDAGFLAVVFDWIIEPVAIKLNYWKWIDEKIPFQNYISWFIVSALLLFIFRKLNNDTRNIFAVHLFMIQLLFFLILRTFL